MSTSFWEEFLRYPRNILYSLVFYFRTLKVIMSSSVILKIIQEKCLEFLGNILNN